MEEGNGRSLRSSGGAVVVTCPKSAPAVTAALSLAYGASMVTFADVSEVAAEAAGLAGHGAPAVRLHGARVEVAMCEVNDVSGGLALEMFVLVHGPHGAAMQAASGGNVFRLARTFSAVSTLVAYPFDGARPSRRRRRGALHRCA